MTVSSSFAIVLSAIVALLLGVIAIQEIRSNWGTHAEHEDKRSQIIQEEELLSIGGTIELTALEKQANAFVMDRKLKELDEGFANLSSYNPAQHFFERKPHIDKSPVFNVIRMMPKGAVLHGHDTALLGTEFLVKNISYMDDLYICTPDAGSIRLFFFKTPPPSPDCTWELLMNVRNNAGDVNEFDRILGSYFTLEVEDPKKIYTNVDVAWEHFGNIFGIITPMLTYKPVWEIYFYEALRQFYEDGVFYAEIRSTLPDLYDLEGNTYGPIEVLRIYKSANDRFRQDYPDSFGSRIIYAPLRLVENEVVHEYIDTAIRAKAEFGDFLAGFDLVGQEDKGRSLHDFIQELITMPGDIDVFYHSGETNWYGVTDYNLIDAVLLGTKRIGHGYALLKHPSISKMVKDKGIAIEVNPLSNQILMLVEDMRNHPASVMIANNFPVVISSDDPGLWGGLPLSHDYYMTFMGLASRYSDLRLLKQLTLNSINYSAMRSEEKVLALQKHDERWNEFINKLIL